MYKKHVKWQALCCSNQKMVENFRFYAWICIVFPFDATMKCCVHFPTKKSSRKKYTWHSVVPQQLFFSLFLVLCRHSLLAFIDLLLCMRWRSVSFPRHSSFKHVWISKPCRLTFYFDYNSFWYTSCDEFFVLTEPNECVC